MWPIFIQVFAALAILLVYRRLKKTTVSFIAGPPSTSWLHGNLFKLFVGQVGECDREWIERYGSVVRLRGSFGTDQLLVSDPKAIQYIYQHAYKFTKRAEQRATAKALTGPGLAMVEGNDHKRQRKIMRPAFGSTEIKTLLPVMSAAAASIAEKLNEVIQASQDQSPEVDMARWMNRGALDAIGKAAFDYDFGCVQGKETPLAASFQNLLLEVSGRPTRAWLTSQAIMSYIPTFLLKNLMKFAPVARMKRMRLHRKLAEATARELIAQKLDSFNAGHEGSRDVMSLLVQANASEVPSEQMKVDEVEAQLMILMIAGHETTATSLTWTLYELCKQPHIQTRLRKEIRARLEVVRGRGDTTFTVQDFEAMPYLGAVMKETLRFDSVAALMFRESVGEDVLPLSKPITLTNGQVLHELPIQKGQKFVISVNSYNRSENIFGQDSHLFNPERWLNDSVTKPDVAIGVYANLLSFSTGIRNCIGWRFALQEMQVFLTEMINNFEFTLEIPAEDVVRDFGGTMIPSVRGHEEKGSYLPVRIRPAPREVGE